MRYILAGILCVCISLLFSKSIYADENVILVNHESTELSAIPADWIDAVQLQAKWHYAHTSHGGQLLTGLNLIEASDTTYGVDVGDSFLPTTSDVLCVFNGQTSETYITPELYWATASGMNDTRGVLSSNPSLNISMWSFCTQLESATADYVAAYLDSMESLEQEFPDVTFIYMTGNAQATGSSGFNRYLRNEQIREFCMTHNKVLYDFADLDAWWLNDTTGVWEYSTYSYNDIDVPVEHPHFNGSESGHTTLESCTQKGRAVWWMLAKIMGWEIPGSSFEYTVTIDAESNSVNDTANQLGAVLNATNGYDIGLDRAEAPIPPNEYLSLYFPHPEWSHPLGNNFTSDMRPITNLTDSMQVWHFNIATDQAGTMSLNFTFSDVGARPVILKDFQSNLHYRITDGQTYTFTIDDTLMEFELAVGDTTPPAVSWITPVQFEIVQSDSILPLAWNYSDGFLIDSVLLSYRLNGGATDIPFQTLGAAESSEWHLPHWDGINQVFISATVKDYAGNSSSNTIPEPILVVGDSLSQPISQGWTLWGVPLVPYDSVMGSNLSDDLTDWVSYDYIDGGYLFNNALSAGRGYWLGTSNSAVLDVTGEVLPNSQQINVDAGWSLISNPLVISLTKSMLSFSDTSETKSWTEAAAAGWITDILYGWNGTGFVPADSLHPWKGYWIGATRALGLNFEYSASLEQSIRTQSTDGWVVQLKCYTTAQGFDEITMLGTASDATDGYDILYDAPKPPPSPFGEVRLVFPHPEWNYSLGNDFAVDIRGALETDSSNTWILHGQSSEQVHLVWESSELPEDINLQLIKNNGAMINLMEVDTIVLSAAEYQSFSIRAINGPVGVANERIIPMTTVLYNNYPNPFNLETTIKFGLPENASVRLTIYDIQGRQIWQYSTAMSSAGWHTIKWDGRDAHGSMVSTGMYFYRLQAGDFVQVKKMTLLK